jgi:RND family efflux transporter MFP subunit
MKHIRPIIAAVVVLAVAGYFGWSYLSGSGTVSRALGGTGTIESDQIAVTPQVSGRILTAPDEEGVEVAKGDVLYTLDASVLALQVDQAKAGVAAAKANLANVKGKSGHTKADVRSAQAQLDQAEIALKMARTQLGYATISSPIDGVVSSIAARPGENAAPGATLALVSDPTSLTVTVFVAETEIGKVTLGQTGTLTTDSTTRSYRGEVVFIGTHAEFTPGASETKDQRTKLVYQVKLRVSDPDPALKAGMPVDVVLQ